MTNEQAPGRHGAGGVPRSSTESLFAPPEVAWQSIDPHWRTVQWIGSAINWLVLGLVGTGIVLLFFGRSWITAMPAAVALVGFVWTAILAWRRYPAWGYAEMAEDLWVRHGVMFRNLTVVPYGRMQVIDVNSGPLQRAFGLATVTLVTASAQTDAVIPGLPADEAARLRDTLSELGDPRGSGL